MKKSLLLLFIVFGFPISVSAQSPKDGKYQSADGFYSFSLTVQDASTLEVVEPNKTSVYKKSGSAYRHAEPQYSNYMLRVASPTTIYTFKDGGNSETEFSWIGTGELSDEDCPLAEKYQELAEDPDDPEVQAYSFCAILAMAKCNYTPEGFATYAANTVMVMKQIAVDKSKCPCTDVIPQSVWNAN